MDLPLPCLRNLDRLIHSAFPSAPRSPPATAQQTKPPSLASLPTPLSLLYARIASPIAQLSPATRRSHNPRIRASNLQPTVLPAPSSPSFETSLCLSPLHYTRCRVCFFHADAACPAPTVLVQSKHVALPVALPPFKPAPTRTSKP